jgi:hypothetical protein
MMNKIFSKILVFLSLLLISISSHAQQYTFKVLTYYGNVEYSSSSTQSWKKVKTGEGLQKDYILKLNRDSYTALMYKDGRTIELQNEGIFKIEELEINIKNSKISVVQKYVNYVAQEVVLDKSEKKDMKTFAAVVRVKPNHIEAAIPAFTKLMDPIVDLSWYSYPQSEQYVISILNGDNRLLFMDLTNDTSYNLDAATINLSKETVYKWNVSDADNHKIASDTISFYLISSENKATILDTLQMLNDEIGSNETPLNVLSLVSFYEKNNLNIEAFNQFNRVITLAPESEEYKKLFIKFLIMNKLYIKASELLEQKK